MNHFTKETIVEGEVSIWAVPKYSPKVDEDPFEYALFAGDNKPWRDGSVMVITKTMTMILPGGVNLVQKTIETLREGNRRDTERRSQTATSGG